MEISEDEIKRDWSDVVYVQVIQFNLMSRLILFPNFQGQFIF